MATARSRAALSLTWLTVPDEEEISGPLFQHSDQKIHAVVIVSAARAPRSREICLGGKGLDLAQNGSAALHGTGHAVSGNAQWTAFQQHLRRVFNLGQTGTGHIEHAKLIRGAIAVLCRPQNAVRQHLIALKIKHRVHDVLHDLGAGNGAVLVHMTHDEHGDLLFLGNSQQTRRTLLDLADCTGRRRDVHTAHGLDGVDDHKVRFFLFNQATDLVHIVFGGQKNIVLRHLQAGCPQLDLPDRLFTRDIKDTVLISERRLAVSVVTPSGRAAAACRAAAVPAFGASAITSSFMVFQLPQLGQRPIQRGLVSPQLEQT